MPSLSVARAHNAGLVSKVHSPTAVLVGGTRGIGQAMALKIAAYFPEPHIIISARKPESATATLAELQKVNPNGTYEYLPCDMCLLQSVRDLVNEVAAKTDKVNLLVITSGALLMTGREETVDGIDRKLAYNYYARLLLINKLTPLLEKAAQQNELASAMSILAATKGGPPNLDDLDLKKGYSFRAVMAAGPTYNDLMVEELSLRHPTVTFLHAYPGIVKTGVMDQLPWYVRLPGKAIMSLSTSPEDCAEYMLYGMTNDEYKGWSLLNEKGDRCAKTKHHTDEARTRVWEHAAELTKLEQ